MSATTAVGIFAMMLRRTTHPPAGANAIVVMSWWLSVGLFIFPSVAWIDYYCSDWFIC